MMVPLWLTRSLLGSPLSRALFIVGLVGAVVTGVLRLHLWFLARNYARELGWSRRRTLPLMRIADSAFALSLVGAGWLVAGTHEPLAILLLSVGVGSAVAFLVVEPATERAAFRDADS
jgi:hypothetical protein